MQIVFLSGGLGTRLREINPREPKGLIRLNGVPFMDYIFKSVIEYNPSSLHFCLGYKSEIYIEYLKNYEKFFKITYSIENEKNLLGTGGALKNALNFLEEDFIVQYGDTVLDFDYKKFFEVHLENRKEMTMTIIHKSKSKEKANLICKKNDFGGLNCIYNKFNPSINSNFVDYGAMAFKKKVFKNEEKIVFDLSQIQTFLTTNSQSYFVEIDKPYIEIGTPESFKTAYNQLKI